VARLPRSRKRRLSGAVASGSAVKIKAIACQRVSVDVSTMSDFCEHGNSQPVSTVSPYRIENNVHPKLADRYCSSGDSYRRSSDLSRRTMRCWMACLDLLPGGDDLQFSADSLHFNERVYFSGTLFYSGCSIFLSSKSRGFVSSAT
jgi:hypothetical protein